MPEKPECDDVSHERELRENWQTAHEKVHDLETVARKIASTEINRRLDEMNQLRKQIETERGTYVTREMYDSLQSKLEERVKQLELAGSNLAGKIWVVGATITVILIAVNLFLTYVMKH